MEAYVNTVICGKCEIVLKDFPDNSIDALVTDPPYGLKFMNRKWDYNVPSVEVWAEVLRILKPGAHLLSFGGTRTYHRMVVNIEDAGFVIRDQIQWLYGSGFPKNMDVSKAIDKRGGKNISWFGEWLKNWREEKGIPQKEIAKLFPSKTGAFTGCVANWELGLNLPTAEQFSKIVEYFNLPFKTIQEAERKIIGKDNKPKPTYHTADIGSEAMPNIYDLTISATDQAKQWDGWGTALKPANEPICLAMKPISEKTIADNVLKWGTGGINIDGCRVSVNANDENIRDYTKHKRKTGSIWGNADGADKNLGEKGRWPSNVILDKEAGKVLDKQSGMSLSSGGSGEATTGQGNDLYSGYKSRESASAGGFGDSGGASRFFYCPKASQEERNIGLEDLPEQITDDSREKSIDNAYQRGKTLRQNNHPTVKPLDLMRYLVRMITSPGGIVLDSFIGSGTTGMAAVKEGFRYIGIDEDEESCEIARLRIAAMQREKENIVIESGKNGNKKSYKQLSLEIQ